MRKWAHSDSVSMEIVAGGPAPWDSWGVRRPRVISGPRIGFLEPIYFEVVGQRTPWSFDRTGAIPL